MGHSSPCTRHAPTLPCPSPASLPHTASALTMHKLMLAWGHEQCIMSLIIEPLRAYVLPNVLTLSGWPLPSRLPDGVTCSACTLQWWWTTSNSCSVPGNPFGDGGMGSCANPQPGPYPEEVSWAGHMSLASRAWWHFKKLNWAR